jgi:hypothetical protein
MRTNVRTKSEVWVSQHPKGSVMLNPRLDQMFVTNKTGAQIWSGLSEGLRLDVIAEQIALAFNVEPECVKRDALRFVDELRRNGLLEGGDSR